MMYMKEAKPEIKEIGSKLLNAGQLELDERFFDNLHGLIPIVVIAYFVARSIDYYNLKRKGSSKRKIRAYEFPVLGAGFILLVTKMLEGQLVAVISPVVLGIIIGAIIAFYEQKSDTTK